MRKVNFTRLVIVTLLLLIAVIVCISYFGEQFDDISGYFYSRPKKNYGMGNGHAINDALTENMITINEANSDTPLWCFDGNNNKNCFYIGEDNGLEAKGTIYLRFKNNSANKNVGSIRELIKIDSSEDKSNHVLFNINYDRYNGIYARISGKEPRGIACRYNFDDGKEHTIALSWFFENELGGTLNLYIDGKLLRVTSIDGENTPLNLNRISLDILTFSDNYQLEEAVIFGDILSDNGIDRLHRDGYDKNNSYNDQYELLGYKRESINMCVLQIDAEKERLWGIEKYNKSKLVYSDDNGISFTTFTEFDSRVRAVHILKDDIFIGLKGKILRSNKEYPNFEEVLRLNNDRYPINGWSITSNDEKILISEYGWSERPARVFESKDNGQTWNVILTLPQNTDHVHAVKIDPYTGNTWVTYGDTTSGILFKENNDGSWKKLFTSYYPDNDQCIDMVFDKDSIIFASDKTTSGTFLSIFNKREESYSLLGSVPKRNLSNVYALFKDSNGILWWYGNHEGVKNRNSTIYLSPNNGKTIILAENLGEVRLNEPHKFLESEEFVFLGDSRFRKPVICGGEGG